MDSLSRIVTSMQLASQDFALPVLSDPDVHEIIGLGLGEAISALYPGLSDVEVQKVRERYAHYYLQEDHSPSQFYDGILPMLEALQQTPALLSVATGKSRRGLDRVMSGVGAQDLFHSSRCADETESKPSPRMVLELLELHQVDPHEAVVVGDTEFDMEMARNAGVDRLGVGWGAHHIDRLANYDPKASFTQVSELVDWLLS